MKKIIVAKQTGKNRWRAHKKYAFQKSEIASFIALILVAGYVAIRVLIS